MSGRRRSRAAGEGPHRATAQGFRRKSSEDDTAPAPACARENFHIRAEDIPSVPGAYILLVEIAGPVKLAMGRKPPISLRPGRYLYCGSARGPGGLRARVSRHMRRGKAIRWHIDRLTELGIVAGAWVFPGGSECDLAASLSLLPMPISGFGSTDCRRCPTHLFSWQNESNLS
jgi:Uri superfamily endonuclease